MENQLPANSISSLKVVREELVSTIEQSAKKLEDFFENTADAESLQACVEGLHQISGTLDLLQLKGPQLLAQSLLSVAQEITPGEHSLDDDDLQAITTAFFTLPRYLEFLENTKLYHPEILLPFINDLRKISNQAALPDSFFFSIKRFTKDVSSFSWLRSSTVEKQDYPSLVGRIRHMFQVGLLAILQGKPQKAPLKIMYNAAERLSSIYAHKPIAAFWLSIQFAVDAAINSSLPLSKYRKRLLMEVEKQIKQLVKFDIQGVKTNVPIALTKELVYWAAIGKHGDQTKNVDLFLEQFGCTRLGYDDEQLAREAELLRGPSAKTIQSVIAVFEEEIAIAKNILENSASSHSTDEFDQLVEQLAKLAEILSVVGLGQPSIVLKQQAKIIETLKDDSTGLDIHALSEVAHALLGVENFVSQYKMQAGYQSVDSELTIADNQYAEAEKIVLQEAENGLVLIKRALSSFAESGFDQGHIRNVSKTLQSIRGGMTLMHRTRCAKVLELCDRFVEVELMSGEHPAVLQQLLEPFADCVISLEYYVSALQSDKNTDDSILQIAEESLASLGLAS
ncbi:pilus assembly protein [Sessilibacter sp. MAH2]